MRQLSKCRKCVQASLFKIHLVDKCLIIFMLVLLAQSAYTLFFPSAADPGADNIDIIVRTSTASIFGYFLSANFIRHIPAAKNTTGQSAQKPNPGSEITSPAQDSGLKNQIGFSLPGSLKNLEQGEANLLPPSRSGALPDPEEASSSRLQIIVAAFIGLFCLLSLLLLRDIALWKHDFTLLPSAAVTVSQFRDLVSGCVGFLIGCPTNGAKQSL